MERLEIRRRVSIVCSALVLLNATGSSAHSTRPVFDDSRRITISGTVREWWLVDPHSGMTVDVIGSDGHVARWAIEMTARFNLVANGWTDSTLRPGDRVTVTGWPARDNSPRMYARSLLSSDGTELMPGVVMRDKAVEEYRRQRGSGR